MIIIGAGMAGLIAANHFRKEHPVVLEAQPSLPHNHEALLRFRTDTIGKMCGMRFKPVEVRKTIYANGVFADVPNPYVCNQYSLKVTGKVLQRSIWDLSPGTRYIAPGNMIELLARGVDVVYGSSADLATIERYHSEGHTIISTIPMNVMMRIIGWKDIPKFEYRPVWVIAGELVSPRTDIYQTIYFSDLDVAEYRASFTGNRFMIELAKDVEDVNDRSNIIRQVCTLFGIPLPLVDVKTLVYKQQEYGKIIPIDDDIRRDFILLMSRKYNLYSFGRFATWRQLLLDDLVNDLNVIETLMHTEGRANDYTRRLQDAQNRGNR